MFLFSVSFAWFYLINVVWPIPLSYFMINRSWSTATVLIVLVFFYVPVVNIVSSPSNGYPPNCTWHHQFVMIQRNPVLTGLSETSEKVCAMVMTVALFY